MSAFAGGEPTASSAASQSAIVSQFEILLLAVPLKYTYRINRENLIRIGNKIVSIVSNGAHAEKD